jgi:hypothetical protein
VSSTSQGHLCNHAIPSELNAAQIHVAPIEVDHVHNPIWPRLERSTVMISN